MTMIKTYTENDVTIHLMPRLNLRYYRILSEANEKLGNPEDTFVTVIIDRFAILEGLGRAPYIEADEEHPLMQYIQQREGKNLLDRLELFETLLDIDDINLIYNAYNETRENVLPLDMPDDIANDEEKKSAGSLNGGQSSTNAKAAQNGRVKSETSTKPLETEPTS